MVIIRLRGLANGAPHELDGQYVVRYDPCPFVEPDGQPSVLLDTTADVVKAKRYPDLTAAVREYRAVGGIRADGLPDRPMTAFNAEFIPVE